MGSAMQAITGLFTVWWVILAGCAGNGVTPTHMEQRFAVNGTAEDHVAAALLYQQKAEQLRSDAARLEQQAEGVTSHQDPKGFRRGALRTAAQTLRQEAVEMEQLHTSHTEMVQSVAGKQQPQ